MSAHIPKERGIIFSGEMVRAILAGKKTQTRRVMKPQPEIRNSFVYGLRAAAGEAFFRKEPWNVALNNRYGKPGDRLWVKETWGIDHEVNPIGEECGFRNIYFADYLDPRDAPGVKKNSSMFMPRSASRITLEITDLRAERLQEITEEDAKAEGCELPEGYENLAREFFRNPLKEVFQDLWDSLNVKRGFGWASNPWVFVISFKRKEAK